MQYLFPHSIPFPWLAADIVTVLLTLWVIVFIIQKSAHPAVHLAKGSDAEWVMLAFHLILPTILLAILWLGRAGAGPSLKDDLPVLAVPVLFHLLDISFALAGGYTAVLPLVVISSLVHAGLLGLIFSRNAQQRSAVPA